MLTTKDIKTDGDIQAICVEFIKHHENHTGYIEQSKRAIQNQDYYRGAIWTEDEVNAYRAKGTEPITINRCRPVVKALVGMYLDNLREPSVIARKNATESMARVWSEVVKHSMDLGGGDAALATLFFQGIKDTRSIIWVEKQQQGPGGKLTFAADGFFETTIDPDCDVYDISDPKRGAKYAFRTQFIDREICELTYPNKKDQFADGMVTMTGASGNPALFRYLTNNSFSGTSDGSFYRYPVYIIYWRQPVNGIKVKKNDTGDTRIVTTKKVKMQDGYSWEKVPTFKMHRSVMVGHTLAEDTVNPFGDDVTDYPAFKFVPLFEPGAEYGVLDDITSLNKEVCVDRTEAQRLLKQTANAGYIVGGGTIQKKQALANDGGINGIIIDKSEYGNFIEKIRPNPLSPDVTMAGLADVDIDRASQVNEEMRGEKQGGDVRVGVVQQRLSQGIKSNLIILSNFWRTMELMGNFLLKVIRKTDIYTNDEIRMIISKSNLIDKKTLAEAESALVDKMDGARLPMPMQPQPPNPQLMELAPPEQRADIYMQVTDGIKSANLYNQRYPRLRKVWDDVVKEQALNQIIEEMRDDDIAEYGLKVVVSAATTSNKLMNWLKEQDLMDRYPGLIPPDIFIEDSGIPRADEIVARLKEAQQRPQQLPPGAGQNPNANANAGSKAALTKQIAMAG